MDQGRVPWTCPLCLFSPVRDTLIRLLEVVSHFIKINRLKVSSGTQIQSSKAANNARTELLKSLFDGYEKKNIVKKDNSECKMSQVFKFHLEGGFQNLYQDATF